MFFPILEIILLSILIGYIIVFGTFIILCLFDGLVSFERNQLKIKYHHFTLKYYQIVLWFLLTVYMMFRVLENFNLLT